MASLRSRPYKRAAQIVIGVVVVVWSLAPIYLAIVVAFSTATAIRTSGSTGIPSQLTWQNFADLLHGAVSSSFYVSMLNSIIQAVGATVLTTILAVPAGYAFARVKFRGSMAVLAIISITLAVPIYLVMIPLFKMMTAAGLINTQVGDILVLTSATLPLAIWILRSHVAALPPDLEGAAQLDGAGTTTMLLRIIGPLIAPGLVAAAVVTFLTAWGSFLIPLIYAGTPETQPLTVLIPQFVSKLSSNYGLQAAAGLLTVVPPIVLVIILQRHLLSGLLRGASR